MHTSPPPTPHYQAETSSNYFKGILVCISINAGTTKNLHSGNGGQIFVEMELERERVGRAKAYILHSICVVKSFLYDAEKDFRLI